MARDRYEEQREILHTPLPQPPQSHVYWRPPPPDPLKVNLMVPPLPM